VLTEESINIFITLFVSGNGIILLFTKTKEFPMNS